MIRKTFVRYFDWSLFSKRVHSSTNLSSYRQHVICFWMWGHDSWDDDFDWNFSHAHTDVLEIFTPGVASASNTLTTLLCSFRWSPPIIWGKRGKNLAVFKNTLSVFDGKSWCTPPELFMIMMQKFRWPPKCKKKVHTFSHYRRYLVKVHLVDDRGGCRKSPLNMVTFKFCSF